MKLLETSEGAQVVQVTDREGRELPPCIVEKSDGSSIYATRDLAAAIYRQETFQFDRMTYIVGAEQKLHFEQVFGVLRRMGYTWESRCEHVPFGLYRFKDAKMSTRKGNFVTLEEVLTMAEERVREILKGRELQSENPEEIISKVALGALVFHDLHSDPVRDVEFDLDRVIDFEGETGPYLQYAHTRCTSLLEKAEAKLKKLPDPKDPAILTKVTTVLGSNPHERALLSTLSRFEDSLERTLKHVKASHLAQYLVELTKAFGVFYRECHVLTDDAEITQARVLLVQATQKTLHQGLTLLGIPLPSRM
jgi:arginyl-tRNA synthetase